MTTVREIESAIHELPENKRWKLLRRFERDLWENWDQTIEADFHKGKLNDLLREARGEIASGQTRPLNEILRTKSR